MRVLVLEDEHEIRDFLVSQLTEQGMQVRGLSSGDQVALHLQEFQPQLILLDQMMPGKSGHEIIREVRSLEDFSVVPIMMVTGLDSEADKVAALELGADDYVTKPFSIKELVARVHALARRAQANLKAPQTLRFKEIQMDLKSHRVFLGAKEVGLTLTEFRILAELIRENGDVLTRDKLRERALGNLNVTDRTIDVHLASLRKKLEIMGDEIQTVRGVGYRMSSPT